MFYRPLLLALSLMSLAILSCQTGSYQASALPPRQLCFGEGGGFTGAVKEYTLLENGQLFFREGVDSPLQELKPVRRSRARALFSELEEMNFSGITLDEPGNIYRFIEWREEGFRHRVSWGRSPELPAPSVQDYYRRLQAVVPQ